jgi:CubicO group peptidase (beta-lactamase class C family)
MLFLYSLLLSCIVSNGQNTQIEKQLDSLFVKHFKPEEPGCAVLVAKEGQIIYQKAFGSADLELNVALKPDMIFQVASITKQFTAIAILKLMEEGKILLKDSVQKYIPDFPSKGYTVSIENLLTHTSGIKDYMQIDYQSPYMERWDFTPKQLIDSFKYYPLGFAPGTKYSYSNSGYYLLGYIIEKISGKKYQRYVQDHILEPLQLSNSYFDTNGIIIPNRVKGSRKEGSLFKNADYWSPSIAYSAGGLLSNTNDLYKWFKALLAGKIIKKETLEKAFTSYKLNDGSKVSYGYGWNVLSQGGTPSIEHGGHMSGFTTNQLYYPEEDVFIALLFNCQDAPRDMISKMVSEIALGRSLRKEVEMSNDQLNSYVGTYALSTDTNRKIEITKKGNGLVAKLPGQQVFEIVFEQEAKFSLKNIKDMTGEFISINGKVAKIVVEQNGRFEWNKIN